MTPEPRLLLASVADAPEILTLQKLAYQDEAAIYDDDQIPPLTQTLEEIMDEFQQRTVLKAVVDGRIIGSVRAHLSGGTCNIGRLIVHPDYRNQGFGTRLLVEIEALFAQAARCELFTGHLSERNLYLYGKQGYRAFRKEPMGPRVTLVYLEKRTSG